MGAVENGRQLNHQPARPGAGQDDSNYQFSPVIPMTMRQFQILLFVCVQLTWLSASVSAKDDEFSHKAVTFFESRIRPLLVDRCLECHGPSTSENGLRLDSRESILKGGLSGTAAIAGDADHSLILQSVRHESDYEMPPDRPLDVQQIQDLKKWIQLGLPWPKSVTSISTSTIPDRIEQHRQQHWAFQPIERPATTVEVPQFQSMIDRLLLENLNAEGLGFSDVADRRTLIRRAYFDLLGIPPTYEECVDFINDPSPDAYERLIERLLDSPRYGERWARHWLDVARYADTRGYTLNNADRNYPFAYTYRDYVIDAFNSDLPFDEFIRQQLAADYMEVPEDKRTLAALGFLTVGRKYLARTDTIDDQVDVVTRGLMGLTVGCARCHDHKFDAISTADYYSLYGVFANCHEPEELPLMGDSKQREQFDAFFAELESRRAAVNKFENEFVDQLHNQIVENLPDYLARAIEPDTAKRTELRNLVLEDNEINQTAVEKWRAYLTKRASDNDPAILPVGELFQLPDENFVSQAKELIRRWNSSESGRFNPIVLRALADSPPRSKAEIGVVYGDLLTTIYRDWVEAGCKNPPLNQFSGDQKQLAKIIFAENSPAQIHRRNLRAYLNAADRKQWDKLRFAVTQHHSSTPSGIRRAMTIREDHPPRDPHILIRGKVNRLGDEVPRQFLQLIQPDRQPFTQRAGRLELAEAIASSENPLTARVFVNRVWMHHFSQPIVDTPSDFGIQCPEPVQRKLLDFLASDFIENGWSIKYLHRTIMTSHAYRQQSQDRAECATKDPENRLVWKMNRRRLEFEALRDSMLAVAGNLDDATHGPPVDLLSAPWSQRRTVYGKIDRQDLPNLYRVFDLASPDQSTAKRIRTTVPQQSLFMMNHGFVVHQARVLAKVIRQIDIVEDGSAIRRRRVEKLYQTVYQRNPSLREFRVASQFLQSAENIEDHLRPWQQLAQVLLWTNEFEFVD
jgi:hypothetical protein